MPTIKIFPFVSALLATMLFAGSAFSLSYTSPYSFKYSEVLINEAGGNPNNSFEISVANGSLTYGVVGYGDDTSDPDTAKGYSNVQVTGIFSVNDDGLQNNLLSADFYNATGYLGRFGANNDGPIPDMKDVDKDGNINIGQLDDGYLNGSNSVRNKDDGYPNYEIEGSSDEYEYDFSGLEFLSSYEDVDNDGLTDDPGWIYLGKNDVDEGEETYATAAKGDYTLEIVKAVNFHLDSGNWVLEMNPDTLALVIPLLGNNTFDHLAFAIKSSTAFEIVDIDFAKIFTWEAEKSSYFNFEPYIITGTLKTSWGQGVSHVSVWAHDPPPDGVVPEPSTLILLGSGLFGLCVYARRRKN